jgi:HEAT repeat protein
MEVRQEATEALGKLGDARAVEPLIACLKDPQWSYRGLAASALGELGDARAVEPLLACLNEPNKAIREGALESLGKLGDARAVGPLIACLKDYAISDKAARALLKLGDERAIPALVSALDEWGYSSPVVDALTKLGFRPSSESQDVYFWIEYDASRLKGERERTSRVLRADVTSGSREKTVNTIYTIMYFGLDELVPALMQALDRIGDNELLEAYLNSGNEELANEARWWASRNGYKVVEDPINRRVGPRSWGYGRNKK